MLWDERKPSHAALMPAESVMAPPGRWGIRGSSLLAFGEKRRKAEVSTPLLYNRAERVCKAGGLFQLTFCPLSDDSQLCIFFAVRYH